jgi:hypothetical protein
LIAWTIAIATFDHEPGEFGYRQLALGDETAAEGGEGNVLLIQLANEFDEQDVELGMNTYCLVDHNQATDYGGIITWTVAGDVITLALDDRAAAAFGADEFALTLGETVDRGLVLSSLLDLLSG